MSIKIGEGKIPDVEFTLAKEVWPADDANLLEDSALKKLAEELRAEKLTHHEKEQQGRFVDAAKTAQLARERDLGGNKEVVYLIPEPVMVYLIKTFGGAELRYPKQWDVNYNPEDKVILTTGKIVSSGPTVTHAISRLLSVVTLPQHQIQVENVSNIHKWNKKEGEK